MNVTEEKPVLVATEADDITADMVITELYRRDVPVVRFNPDEIDDSVRGAPTCSRPALTRSPTSAP